jgi:HK97 family phage portal protein
MGLWSRLISAVTGKSGVSIDEWWETYGYSNRSATGITVNQTTALQVSTVMACVSLLSEDLAKLPVHVYARQKNGGKEIVDNHPLERLFRTPNGWQTRFEFHEMMMTALVLRGNAYAVILRDGRGRPTSLVPVNPDRIWIYEAQSGDIFYQVSRRGPHDMAVLASMPLMIHSDDILHIRWMAIENSLWGVSRIQLEREAIGLSLAQQELASRLAGNNANLGGVLQTEQKLTKDAAERIRQSWKEKYGGVRNAGETAVLEQGLKWQPLGMTAVDAEFLNSRKFSVEEIARMFRVPLYKLQVEGRSTGSQLVQADQEYLNSVLSSYCNRFTAKYEQCFEIDGHDQFVEFDYAHLLRADIMTRLTAMRIGVVGMIYTPNEARRGEGLPDVDGGDTLYQPTNVAPIGFDPSQNQSGPGSDVTGEPAPGGLGDPASPPPDSAPSN